MEENLHQNITEKNTSPVNNTVYEEPLPAPLQEAGGRDNEKIYPNGGGNKPDSRSDSRPDIKPDTMKSYRADCLKLGFFLTVTLLIRDLASGLSPLLERLFENPDTASPSLVYAIKLMYSGICLQIIPSILAAVMLKYSLKNICGGFKAPKNTKKAALSSP